MDKLGHEWLQEGKAKQSTGPMMVATAMVHHWNEMQVNELVVEEQKPRMRMVVILSEHEQLW